MSPNMAFFVLTSFLIAWSRTRLQNVDDWFAFEDASNA